MPFDAAHPTLRRALDERGYQEPTPVQAAVLDPALARRDLLVSAQTGSGKTVAFGLAIADELLGASERFEAPRAPLALVVAPTRELAMQVQRELAWLYAPAGARVVSCVGGTDIRRDERALFQGAHIVVGTPGRLCDHLARGRITLSELRAVVLDEADEMLDMGFREDLERLLDGSPESRRTLLFSATIPKPIAQLAKRYQKEAERIATSTEHEAHGDIAYRAMLVVPHERDHAVVNVLRFFEARGALVFCSTRDTVTHLYGNLQERGFSVVALSGELTQQDRTRALTALRDGRARVCVATDVAARGLDLPDLGLVVHADLPQDKASLLHRSGRTGRAGRKGTCALLVPVSARDRAERLLRAGGISAEWSTAPSAEAIRERDDARLVREIGEAAAAPLDEDLVLARALLAVRTPEEIAAALVRSQREKMPAPEELTDTSAAAARSSGARPPRAVGRAEPTETTWFRMNVGHANNADPRWLLPFLCRRGHVGKDAIGRIQIFDRETRFEVARAVADRFGAAARRPDPQEPHIRIERENDARGGGRPRPPHVGPRGRVRPQSRGDRSR
jgi:ATP-dependent RNA helicase DeaD